MCLVKIIFDILTFTIASIGSYKMKRLSKKLSNDCQLYSQIEYNVVNPKEKSDFANIIATSCERLEIATGNKKSKTVRGINKKE